ncbi:MAG TPA: phosphoribosylanthranilate isomerase [Chitinophagaceae bacterium]|jgi:phosphoribosylanthranilate isomerase|nr:phosphoribosylanthranilate isomerase [Chitinophagaceae bacterium]
MKIKVCGNTLPHQVSALDELGVTFAGFIFYPKSPRYMAQKISPEKMRQIKGKIIKVGVFVNPAYEELMKTVEDHRLDMVQLHGDESPKFCDKIADYISVIKAFRLSENDSVMHMTQPYAEVCDFFMFDTLGVGYGGTGKKFDWTVLQQSLPLKPYFLSGGIEPGDEKKLEEFIGTPAGEKLFAIDINTKFEIGPGVKDVNSIKKFAENLGIKKLPK